MEKIRLYLQDHKTAKTNDIAELIDLSVTRARAVLFVTDDVKAPGTNKIRTYCLRER